MAPLAAFLPTGIPLAAESFFVGTSLEADNLAPRALARLSAGGLVALAAPFTAFEECPPRPISVARCHGVTKAQQRGEAGSKTK